MCRCRRVQRSGGADTLIAAMKDPSAQVRHFAVQAAGKLGGTGGETTAKLVPHVVALLRDKKEQVQAAAAGTLHLLQNADALGALLPCVLGEPSGAELVRRPRPRARRATPARARAPRAFDRGTPPRAREAPTPTTSRRTPRRAQRARLALTTSKRRTRREVFLEPPSEIKSRSAVENQQHKRVAFAHQTATSSRSASVFLYAQTVFKNCTPA